MWQYNYSTELYHFGVKGMKWGHRKASYSSSTTGSKGSKRSKGQSQNQQKQPMSTQKKVAIGAAALAATGLAVYGGYKVNKYLNSKITESYIKTAKEYSHKSEISYSIAKDFFHQSYKYDKLGDRVNASATNELGERYAKEAFNKYNARSIDYMNKAREGKYSLGEKSNYVATAAINHIKNKKKK